MTFDDAYRTAAELIALGAAQVDNKLFLTLVAALLCYRVLGPIIDVLHPLHVSTAFLYWLKQAYQSRQHRPFQVVECEPTWQEGGGPHAAPSTGGRAKEGASALRRAELTLFDSLSPTGRRIFVLFFCVVAPLALLLLVCIATFK